jgi:hypothetical protein
MRDLIVTGGGELARVIIETAIAGNWRVIGFVDPEMCPETTERLDLPAWEATKPCAITPRRCAFLLSARSR